MQRFFVMLTIVCVIGCGTGEITMTAWSDMPDAGGDSMLSDGGGEETASEYFVENVRDVFQPCTSCHQGGAYNRPFLDGWPDVQENFFGPQAQHLIDLENPESSAVLSRVSSASTAAFASVGSSAQTASKRPAVRETSAPISYVEDDLRVHEKGRGGERSDVRTPSSASRRRYAAACRGVVPASHLRHLGHRPAAPPVLPQSLRA